MRARIATNLPTAPREKTLVSGQYMDDADKYLRLALKAQSQCRATLETLVVIKNPPVICAKQANFAKEPQRVNKCITAQSQAQARIIESESNKLLEEGDGKRMDTRAHPAPIRANQIVEAMGTVRRT